MLLSVLASCDTLSLSNLGGSRESSPRRFALTNAVSSRP